MGYWAKKVFKEKIDQKSFVLVYIYFLMPIIMIWGIMERPIDWDLIQVPTLYLITMIITFGIGWVLSQYMLTDPKDRAITRISGLIGNTGNIGIPLSLAVWGIHTVPYTAMINLMTAIFVMTVGAYNYSRGRHSVRQSVTNVLKLPMIWATILAFSLQYFSIELPKEFDVFLEMGAYTGLTIQLIIFGMFAATVKIKNQHPKLTGLTMVMKFGILPGVGWCVCAYFKLPELLVQIILLQCLVPIAVNNVNLASLFDCDPDKVSWLSLLSVAISIILIPWVLSTSVVTW